MKIYYIANVRLPTEKAHGIQIMKTCEALVDLGNDVELVVTDRYTPIEENAFDYYDARKNFRLLKLRCLDVVDFGWLGFWITTVSFMARVTRYSLFKTGIFYTRDEFVAFCLKLIGKKVVWEAHMGQRNIFVRFLIRMKIPVVVISQGLKDLYLSMGMDEDKIMIAHDGVDLEKFNIKSSKFDARAKLNLDKNQKFVVYTGSDQPGKGVDILEKAQNFLPEGIRVIIVSNKPHQEIPLYLQAADILVLPNSSKNEMSRLFTSPMKLFEYMASGVPIIASRVPSLQEVLTEKTALFFEPDDPKGIVTAVHDTLSDPASAFSRAKQAQVEVVQYTWKKRAEIILTVLSNA
ncbi:MAG: glycosyltransferase [Candidatus Paceibacterota bacterium]